MVNFLISTEPDGNITDPAPPFDFTEPIIKKGTLLVLWFLGLQQQVSMTVELDCTLYN